MANGQSTRTRGAHWLLAGAFTLCAAWAFWRVLDHVRSDVPLWRTAIMCLALLGFLSLAWRELSAALDRRRSSPSDVDPRTG